MGSSQPSVYFVLGTPGSGRRDIVRDLIENGLEATERAVVLLAEGEAANPAEEKLAARANTEVRHWKWEETDFPTLKLASDSHVFFLADPRTDPMTQLEALKPWLAQQGAVLARVFCVVDCGFAEKQPVLKPWYEACIHFSDVVFLTKREGVANKWISEFLRHFEDECFPSLFIQVKKGGIANPALVLEPQPRRVSQYFDEGEDFADLVIETDDEDDDDEDVDDGLPQPEPYFVRQRSGRREKELPDIREYLPAK